MTERHAGYWVVLQEDIREDDAQDTLNAIQMVKGVAGVVSVSASFEHVMARQRRDRAWKSAIANLAVDGPPEADDV